MNARESEEFDCDNCGELTLEIYSNDGDTFLCENCFEVEEMPNE